MMLASAQRIMQEEGAAGSVAPAAVDKINSMDMAKLQRRIRIAREAYDQRFLAGRQSSSGGHSGEWWQLYGHGLTSRYDRERDFYSGLGGEGGPVLSGEPTGPASAEPGIDIHPVSYRPGPPDRHVSNIILHSTDGNEHSDINTLTRATSVYTTM
jgi:hypothetical protein